MASFNPEPAEVQDPVYFHWSHPAEQPPADRSAAEAIKGVGEVGTTALKLTDELLKTGIKKSVYGDVDPLTERYKTDLENEKSSLTGNPNQDLDPALKTLKQSASTLVSARGNNKMSETLYRGSIDALAKDYRSRFPGYREEIDQIFQEATGSRSTANQYIQSLVGDINAMKAKKDAYGDKINTFMLSHMQDYPEMPTLIQLHREGNISDTEVLQRINPRIQAKQDLEQTMLELKTGNERRDTTQKLASDAFGNVAVNEVHGALDHIMLHLANGGDMALSKFVQGVQNKTIQFTDQDIANAQVQMATYKQQVSAHLLQIATKKDRNDPLAVSPLDLAGPAKIQEQISSVMKNLFDPVQETFSDKEGIGLGVAIKRSNEAIGQDAAHLLFNDDQIGAAARVLKGATLAAGPGFAAQMISDSVGLTPPKLDAQASQLLQARLMNKNVQGPPDPRQPGVPQADSLLAVVNTINSPSPVAKKTFPNPKETVKSTIQFMAQLHNPQLGDEAKITMAQKAFNPNNIGLISLFANYGERQVYIPGQGFVTKGLPSSYQVFNTLFSPANSKEMVRLGQGHQDLLTNYQNLAEHSFGSELYATEIQELGRMMDVPGVKIIWNPKTLGFKAEGSVDTLNQQPQYKRLGIVENPTTAAMRIQDRLDFLNGAISNMAALARARNLDPNAYVTGLIAQVSHDGRVPTMMRDAVIASRPELKDRTEVPNQGARGLPGMKINSPAASPGASLGAGETIIPKTSTTQQ